MTFTRVLAQSTVSDLDGAPGWYSRLLDRALMWHLPLEHGNGGVRDSHSGHLVRLLWSAESYDGKGTTP